MVTALILFLVAIGGVALFLYSFPAWIVWLYGISMVILAFSAGAFGFLTAKAKKKQKPIKSGIICAAVFTAVFAGLVFLVNNVIYGGGKAAFAARLTAVFPILFLRSFCFIMPKQPAESCCLRYVSARRLFLRLPHTTCFSASACLIKRRSTT